MTERIKELLTASVEALQESLLKINDIQQIVINKDFFDEEYCKKFDNNAKSEYLREQLNRISLASGPVLYWFEFDDLKIDKSILRNAFISYKDPLKGDFGNPNYRYASSYKDDFKDCRNVLYVGKVERGFYQRIKTHLGYATSKHTAGMQLHFWYGRDIDNFGDLKLNFIEFKDDMKHLIAVLEKKIAWDLRPLIGKY